MQNFVYNIFPLQTISGEAVKAVIMRMTGQTSALWRANPPLWWFPDFPSLSGLASMLEIQPSRWLEPPEPGLASLSSPWQISRRHPGWWRTIISPSWRGSSSPRTWTLSLSTLRLRTSNVSLELSLTSLMTRYLNLQFKVIWSQGVLKCSTLIYYHIRLTLSIKVKYSQLLLQHFEE